jgi:aspartyl/glutamyl-tRNA(Asn/Gln) amidotransferase C subunit
MIVNSEIVENILELSNLEIKDEDKKDLSYDLNKILNHMKSLNNVDVENVEEFFHACFEKNALREDRVEKFPSFKKFLENYSKDSYFNVPEIISNKRES